jgi:creatinine amidohydrolase
MEIDTDRHFIERMHWDEVAVRLGDGAVAILPIGAAAKQHGFHLPLNTDRIQGEWLAGQMAKKIDALIWPTLTYGHYPAFTEYAGSISLSISTFEALVREVAGQILGSGCSRLLVLNTGISTLAPVDRALARLASERIKHLWIHGGPRYPRVARQLAEQSHGSHADELETSVMLALAPHLVDMTRAEASPNLAQAMPGALTPSDPSSPNYSRSGSYGDPTRATSAKGEALLAAMLDDLHEQATKFIAQNPGEQRSPAVQSVLR